MTKDAIAKEKSKKWYANKDQMVGGVGVVPLGTEIDVSGLSDVEFSSMVKADLIVSEEPEVPAPAPSEPSEPPKPSKSKVAKPSKKKGRK